MKALLALLALIPTFLSTAPVALAAPVVLEGPFLELDFEQGLQRAAEEEKLLLVAFYAEDCEICDQMDSLTLTESRVHSWMGRNMLAVRIGEEETALAERFKVTSRPTYLILSPDGTPQERIEGYRNPLNFLRFSKVAREGGGFLPVQSAYELDPTDADVRMRYGRILMRRQQPLEALGHLLWVFDNTRDDPDWSDRRLEDLLREIVSLQRSLPDVSKELTVRRDRVASVLLEDYDPATPEPELVLCARELSSINRMLMQNQHTTFAWSRLGKREGFPPSVRNALFNTFVEAELLSAGRYEDLLATWGDPIVLVNERLSQYLALKSQAEADPSSGIKPNRELNSLLADVRKYYEALLATGNDAVGEELSSMLLALTQDDQSFVTLVTAAFKAGRDEKAEELITLAKQAVNDPKERKRMLQVFVRLRNQRKRTLERAEQEKQAEEARDDLSGAKRDS